MSHSSLRDLVSLKHCYGDLPLHSTPQNITEATRPQKQSLTRQYSAPEYPIEEPYAGGTSQRNKNNNNNNNNHTKPNSNRIRHIHKQMLIAVWCPTINLTVEINYVQLLDLN